MGDEYRWILSDAGILAVLCTWVFIAAGVVALGEKISPRLSKALPRMRLRRVGRT